MTGFENDGMARPFVCCMFIFFASSESESLGVMVYGGWMALNEVLLDRAPLLKLGGKDSRLDDGDVRKGRDCRRFCEV